MIVLNLSENLAFPEEEEKLDWLQFARQLSLRAKDFLIYLSLGAAGLGLLIVSTQALGETRLYQELSALVTSKSEPFTSLYFEHSAHLPQEFKPGEAVEFSFTIANQEGEYEEYPYVVYFESAANQKRIQVDQGRVSIGSGEQKTIAESYTFKQDHDQERLVVKLLRSGQEIHFILNQANPQGL